MTLDRFFVGMAFGLPPMRCEQAGAISLEAPTVQESYLNELEQKGHAESPDQ